MKKSPAPTLYRLGILQASDLDEVLAPQDVHRLVDVVAMPGTMNPGVTRNGLRLNPIRSIGLVVTHSNHRTLETARTVPVVAPHVAQPSPA